MFPNQTHLTGNSIQHSFISSILFRQGHFECVVLFKPAAVSYNRMQDAVLVYHPAELSRAYNPLASIFFAKKKKEYYEYYI